MENTEPQDEDYIITDMTRGGYLVSIIGSRIHGKDYLMFDDCEKAEEAIRGLMKADKFYPDVWFINDHGNALLLNIWEGRQH
jgi:hypothetical protein